MGEVINIDTRRKYISVVACCDGCFASWIAHMRENDYTKYLKDKRGICPFCHSHLIHYCERVKQ